MIPTQIGMKAGAWPRQIGRRMKRARVAVIGLSAQVTGFDPFTHAERVRHPQFRRAGLAEASQGAELASLDAPMPADGKALISRAELALPAPGAVLVNTAQARQVDEPPLPGLTITTFPAAHETLERNGAGDHLFLGYGMTTEGLRIYHSGDGIPYPGLAERIAGLPVSGRDPSLGEAGSFTLEEALDPARAIPFVGTHHWGMFAFNTLGPARIDQAALTRPGLLRPKAGEAFRIS